jgi:tetratricopeptide (TPR) repeat protein
VLSVVLGLILYNPPVSEVAVVYPPDEAIFPPDFTAPTFLWRDANSKANRWTVEISAEQGGSPLRFDCDGAVPPPLEIDKRCIAETNEIYVPPPGDSPLQGWRPDAEAWKRIKQQCGRSQVSLTITGFASGEPGKPLSSGRISISVSNDPVAAPIFYRDVPLMPAKLQSGIIKPLAKEALPLIAWRLRDVSRPESRVVMEDMPSCANCHTFSADGKTLGMDIDGPAGDKGAYGLVTTENKMVIEKKDLITWNSFPEKLKGHKTIGFMSQVSPDGQYVVSTVNESVVIVNFTAYKFLQVFYPTRGILAFYSRKSNRIEALPGADDVEYVHCDPAWSPDGKYLVFARARARDPHPPGSERPMYANDPKELKIQYDLYRIPFNQGRGGKPEPIAGASDNGMSNTFPKISPDGRWIVFVQCRNGQLMRPDSRLWIVPTAGGKAREMNCNTSLMNSWHSFSPNSRWMVFSSKSNTPYTQMFLTHIDENGNSSPAILIPDSTAPNRAVNLPELANIAYDDLVSINVPAVDWRRDLDRGRELVKSGRPVEAIAFLKKSIDIDPEQSPSRFQMGVALDQLRRRDEALVHYTKAIELNPHHSGAHNNIGILMGREGKLEQAIEHFRKAVAADETSASPRNNWGKALMKLGKVSEAIPHFQKAVALDPESANARRNLAHALRQPR